MTATFTLQITGSYSAVLLFPANPPPFMVVNGDSQNTIYLGDDSSCGFGNLSESIPLLPGASVGFTSDRHVPTYINGTPGVVSNVYIIPGASGYFRPISDLILQGLNPGIFIYRPAAGFNTLAGAWTALGGVDQYGNEYGAGITLNQGRIQGISVTNGTIFGTYVQGSNIANASIGGASISGGTVLGTDIIQTQQAGVLLGYGSGLLTETISSSQDWPVPVGVTVGDVECYAGMGGGSANGIDGGGDGAGGPEYSREPNYPLPSGGTVQAIIGHGGSGANGSGMGGDGGTTSFDGTVIAHGGKGNGKPGTGSINTINFPGGQGGLGSSLGGGGGGGGGGGPSGPGAPGATAVSAAGALGGNPGGGDGGSASNPGLPGTAGGGGGAGSGSPGTVYEFFPSATYSYYGGNAATNPANSKRNANSVMYAGEDVLGTINGNQYSFAYYGSIQTALQGLTVVSCQLVLTVDYVVNGALSGTLVIGYAGFTSFPDSAMSLLGASPDIAQCAVTGQAEWSIDLSATTIPAAFASGGATCLLFGPGPNTTNTYFSEIRGGSGQNAGPKLIFQTN